MKIFYLLNKPANKIGVALIIRRYKNNIIYNYIIMYMNYTDENNYKNNISNSKPAYMTQFTNKKNKKNKLEEKIIIDQPTSSLVISPSILPSSQNNSYYTNELYQDTCKEQYSNYDEPLKELSNNLTTTIPTTTSLIMTIPTTLLEELPNDSTISLPKEETFSTLNKKLPEDMQNKEESFSTLNKKLSEEDIQKNNEKLITQIISNEFLIETKKINR